MPGTFDGRLAFASILFPTPGAPAFRTQSGDFASVAVVGGVTRLTFQDPIAPYQGFPSLTLRSATGGYVSVVDWTSTYLDVETLDTTGAPAEIEFDLTVVQQTVSFVVPPAPPPPPPGPSLVGLQAWWRADDIALANGAPVVTWIDRTANGNDLTVPAGGVSPTYITSDPLFNGQAAVNFTILSGFRKALPVGFGSGSAALAAYMVLKFDPDPSLGFNTIIIMGWGIRPSRKAWPSGPTCRGSLGGLKPTALHGSPTPFTGRRWWLHFGMRRAQAGIARPSRSTTSYQAHCFPWEERP